MDDDMDALFSSFMTEVSSTKSNKRKKLEEKAGTPEEIIERITAMKYDPKNGEGSAYIVLGVTPEASESEITKTYRKLSVLIHPDKCKHELANDAFQILAKAYADTKDPNYNDKYREIVGKAKAAVKKQREQENKARAKRGEDPLDMDGHEFDMEVLRECERMAGGGGTAEEKAEKNEVFEANMKRWNDMARQAKKARVEEVTEKKKFDRQRDKRAAGWQTFMSNVDSKKFASQTWNKIGLVGAADMHHRREERGWMHQEGKLKAAVDVEDEKISRSDTQAGQTGVDRSYMKAWR
eukprot:TRINITY_DN75267_c0_g1_i1.p1 TRINITY_DN75267_c0_g1~~TRINITY_DN75267_c0_g1_i1.p1  ORF type:complete len:295 (+),score=107.38 TRINITY_DN75267_c0_g1_i1:138-1022(+)